MTNKYEWRTVQAWLTTTSAAPGNPMPIEVVLNELERADWEIFAIVPHSMQSNVWIVARKLAQ